MGAELVPQVRGSRIGSIDVLRRRVRALTDDYLSQHTADLFDEYNSKIVNFRVLWGDHFITSDEGHVKYMLTGEGFEHFPNGYWWQERFESFLGNGIFNRDGSEWHSHRQIACPWFSRERISDFNIFDKHATTTVDHISRFATSQTPFDFQDLAGRFTLDSASEFLFDSCVNALHGALPVAGKARVEPKGSASDDDLGSFAWAFENIQMQVARRMMIGNIWPLFELVNDRTKESNAIVHGWVTPVVERALREKATRTSSNGGETFLSHLVDSTDNAEDIRNQVLNMLLAGRDTTAALLTFTVYLLSIHPDVMDRLRAEIINEYGIDGQPAPESMRKLSYLRAVLNETRRLFPPVPLNIRVSDDKPQVFPATKSSPKYYIPPNTQISFNTMLIQRNKDTWSEYADEFNPDRWLDPIRIKRVTDNPFMFIPFHAGPRIRLGQNFTYNEASFFLVRLLQKVRRVQLAPDVQPESTTPRPWWKEAKGRQAIEQV